MLSSIYYVINNGKAFYTTINPGDDVEQWWEIYDTEIIFHYLLRYPELFKPQTIHQETELRVYKEETQAIKVLESYGIY